MDVGSFVVAEDSDTLGGQSPGQVPEGFVSQDGFITVVGARTVDKEERWKGSIPFGNGYSSGEFPPWNAKGDIPFGKLVLVGRTVEGRILRG